MGNTMAPPSIHIEMRAGEGIWDYNDEEPDEYKRPGVARPLVIMDERADYLHQTDKHLAPGELLQRVRSIIDRQRVPVDVFLANARWIKDKSEVRHRIVAQLRSHSYSDVKMIMGLDYMGDWATFNMQVAMQPDPIPPMPPSDSTGTALIIVGIIIAVLGIPALAIIIGILMIPGGLLLAWYGYKMNERSRDKSQQNWLFQQQKRALEKFSRTYKVDDMRLFSTAMKSVFQEVVDDIVERGGTVVRVQGGQGGYFENTAPSTVRKVDAAQTEV